MVSVLAAWGWVTSVITYGQPAPFAAWARMLTGEATGNGGTCYGDSGGPNFLGAGKDETDVIAGITITGDALCKSTNAIYRLDTESARVPLPVRHATLGAQPFEQGYPPAALGG